MADIYIKLQDAKDAVQNALYDGTGYGEALNAVPAADVRPVVRGRFAYIGQLTDAPLYQCSSCKGTVGWPSKFCPNCGADMREEEL